MALGNINKVTLMGRLGKDPEIRRMQDGTPIVNIQLATSEGWKDKQSGERRERTEWHTVVVFGRPGENGGGGLVQMIEKWVAKGDQVHLEGKMQTRKWQDTEGKDRWSTEVVLRGFNDSFQIITSKAMDKNRKDSGGTDGGPPLDNTPGRAESFGNLPPSGGPSTPSLPDDDIPF